MGGPPLNALKGILVVAVLFVLALPVMAIHLRQPLIDPADELVRVCKTPMFRRAKEFIVRGPDQKLYYVNRSGGIRVPLEFGALPSKMCRSHGKVL